jgi:GLPGLI family protein
MKQINYMIFVAFLIISISCKSQEKSEEIKKAMDKPEVNLIEFGKKDKNSNVKMEDSYLITYEETKNIDAQLQKIPDPSLREQLRMQLSIPVSYKLMITGEASVYTKEEQKGKSEKGVESNEQPKFQVIQMKSESQIYKNRKEKIYLKGINFLGKDFLIDEELKKIDWKLISETKKIEGFDCKKATAIINNEVVEVWYSTSIAVSDGPADYWGLPGLIVEVKTMKIYYLATRFEKVSKIEVNRFSKGKKVSRDEFEKIKEESIGELQSNYNYGK